MSDANANAKTKLILSGMALAVVLASMTFIYVLAIHDVQKASPHLERGGVKNITLDRVELGLTYGPTFVFHGEFQVTPDETATVFICGSMRPWRDIAIEDR